MCCCLSFTVIDHLTKQVISPQHIGPVQSPPIRSGRERSCIILEYHLRPDFAKLPDELLRAVQLYEQEPGEPCGSTRLGEYVQRWVRWAGAGLGKAGRICAPLTYKTNQACLVNGLVSGIREQRAGLK
jgi:hypothetical protein